MSRSPLLAPCRAARKQPQRRTSLYLCTTRRGQVIFRGGLWNAVGGRLTGEAGDKRAGRVGGEGKDSVLPVSEGGGLPGESITQHLRARHDRRGAGFAQAHPGTRKIEK